MRSVTSLSVLAALAVATPAHAQVSDIDFYPSAPTIGALPFSDARDISAATGQLDDPLFAGELPTLWYRFTPDEDMLVRVDTTGSTGLLGVVLFADPPSEATVLGGELVTFDVQLTADVDYVIALAAVEPSSDLVLHVTRLDGPAEPVDLTIGPADAADLQAIIDAVHPYATLTVTCLPGDYTLAGTVALGRGDVTFRAADPSQRPRFFGDGAGPIFAASGVSDLTFQDLELTNDSIAMAFDGVAGLTLERVAVTSVGGGVILAGGRDAAVRDSAFTSDVGPALALEEVTNIEVTRNTVRLTTPVDENAQLNVGMVLVGPEPGAPEELAEDLGTITVSHNDVTTPSGLGFVAISFADLAVVHNEVDGFQGIVAIGVDVGRTAGRDMASAEVAHNDVRTHTIGIVGSGALGHIAMHDNDVILDLTAPAPADLLGLGGQVGIVAAKLGGTVAVTDNSVLAYGQTTFPSYGIFAYGAPEPLQSGFMADEGLSTFTGNQVLGAAVGIYADSVLGSSATIADNDVWLGARGEVGIVAARAGGDLMVEAFHGIAGWVDHPFTIAHNRIYAFELPDPSGIVPNGIEAWSLTWATAPRPLVVRDNTLLGTFDIGINAVGTPAHVRRNSVTGAFAVGVDTRDFPPVDRGEVFGGNIAEQLAAEFMDQFPATTSAVSDNVMRLLVRRSGVLPVVTEPGATVTGNRFGYLIAWPWRP